MILAATQTGTSGGSQTQCAPVTFNPPDGTDSPGTVLMSTTTIGAHIFYTKNNTTGVTPTHSGDNATGTTIRIGSNSGTDNSVGSLNHDVVLKALAYKSGLLDSTITTAIYPPQGADGGGGG